MKGSSKKEPAALLKTPKIGQTVWIPMCLLEGVNYYNVEAMIVNIAEDSHGFAVFSLRAHGGPTVKLTRSKFKTDELESIKELVREIDLFEDSFLRIIDIEVHEFRERIDELNSRIKKYEKIKRLNEIRAMEILNERTKIETKSSAGRHYPTGRNRKH